MVIWHKGVFRFMHKDFGSISCEYIPEENAGLSASHLDRGFKTWQAVLEGPSGRASELS